MLTENICIPFMLDKTSKIHFQLPGSLEFKGQGWHCGLLHFSIDKKWSLINEAMTIIYTNGYKSVIKPKVTHSVEELDSIIDEMFLNRRAKRSDIFEEITFNDTKSEEVREVTPPPEVHPFDPKGLDTRNNTEKPQRVVTPPPGMMPTDVPEEKPEINDDRMKVVTYPSDEPGKAGRDKYYIIYENLNDAFYYSPELPIQANHFTTYAYDSVNFMYNSEINRYEVTFDIEYVRAIHITPIFAKALGLKEVVHNGDVGISAPAKENLHSSIYIHLNDIICPVRCGPEKQNVLDIVTVTSDSIAEKCGPTVYSKMDINRIEHVDIEFKDRDGNPIYGNNATGHVWLKFVKYKKKVNNF